MRHILLVNRKFGDINKCSRDLLVCHFTILECKRKVGLCYRHCIVCRVYAKHFFAFDIFDFLVEACVVVAKHDDVEAWNLLSNDTTCIFFIVFRFDAAFTSAVEKSNNNIGVFFLLNDFHPFLCRFHHVVKAQSLPNILCQPVGNSWGEHAQHGNLDAITLDDCIRMRVRLSGLYVNNVARKHGAFHLFYPLVINSMAGFDVMIADCFSIIA